MTGTTADHIEKTSGGVETTLQDNGEKSVKSEHHEETTPKKEPLNASTPKPWPFENWIPGGYSRSRMLRFKSPSTMYRVINLFAGMYGSAGGSVCLMRD